MSVTKTTPSTSSKTTTSGSIKADGHDFAFGKQNYILMLVGIVFIAVGFILMIGGGSDDPNVFSEAIFDFRRLTLAPTIVLIGFVIEIFAIMKTSKE
ncbi:MAG: DUF3098 domain-containing protein [Bacteroidetes bacterium]|nr:DUF3098 domain-containing protein [Bacteroidota bacterium]HET6245727.1 DUF3098 domain-containing protein [Bacteroidia bacterium]